MFRNCVVFNMRYPTARDIKQYHCRDLTNVNILQSIPATVH